MLRRAQTSLLLLLLTSSWAFAQDRASPDALGPDITSLAMQPLRDYWVDAEALLWWMRPAKLPPLVTASPPGTPQAAAGVLGAPGTSVLFGGSAANGELTPGGRITARLWPRCQGVVGIEGYFFLNLPARRSTSQPKVLAPSVAPFLIPQPDFQMPS
jgi:hypothetical protein